MKLTETARVDLETALDEMAMLLQLARVNDNVHWRCRRLYEKAIRHVRQVEGRKLRSDAMQARQPKAQETLTV